MDDKLLPCPFCGGTNLHLGPDNRDTWVGCDECPAMGPDGDTPKKAKELWNTRLPDPRVTRLVEAAKKVRKVGKDGYVKDIREVDNAWSELRAALAAFEGHQETQDGHH